MTLNKKILSALVLSGLIFGCANASDLVQMDIRKTSENAVDVTFYATEASGSPMVTRKSNNKYVVLMPNVAGKNAGAPDLSSVRDIITNVDIKNVDDGLNGYTKVTFITTKPINISTNIKKTAPLTKEENEARGLIAQAKTHPKQTVAPVQPKKEVTATKVTSSTGAISDNKAKKADNNVKEVKLTQPKKEAKITSETAKNKIQKPANALKTVKQENIVTPQAEINKTSKETTNKTESSQNLAPKEKAPTVKSSAIVTENLNLKELDKIEKVAKPQKKSNGKSTMALIIFPVLALFLFIKFLKSAVQRSNALRSSFHENLNEHPYAVQENYEELIGDENLNWQEKYQRYVEETSSNKPQEKSFTYKFISTPKSANPQPAVVHNDEISDNVQNDVQEEVKPTENSKEMPTGIPKALSTIKKSKPANRILPFVKNNSPKFIPAQETAKTIDKKADEQNISKETPIDKKPVDSIPVNYAKNTSNSYDDGVELKKFSDFKQIKFISKVDSNSDKSILSSSDKKRLELEHTLTKTPDIYKKKPMDISNTPINKVKSETESINKGLQAVKLTAFATPPSFKTADRSKLKKDFIASSDVKEAPHVNLENNGLNISSRSFKGANLNIDEMKLKNKYRNARMLPNELEEVKNEQKYIVSSLDEYFNILDTEKASQRPDLSEKVASSLANIKPSMRMKHNNTNIHNDNPISGKSSRDYLSGLVVKQSYNIDEHKGLYLVSLDGANAIIGRVDSEIFVLEKFNNEVEKMQVRLDSDNVYMVKAGNYKALVDASGDKMGVLIQL